MFLLIRVLITLLHNSAFDAPTTSNISSEKSHEHNKQLETPSARYETWPRNSTISEVPAPSQEGHSSFPSTNAGSVPRGTACGAEIMPSRWTTIIREGKDLPFLKNTLFSAQHFSSSVR